jgi:tetratricopeptide (TPR) repeat protein
MKLAMLGFLLMPLVMASSSIEDARDRQDRAALEASVKSLSEAARKSPKDAGAQYRSAQARSHLAEVALQLGDKAGARTAAEAGIQDAERAVALQGNSAEYHRILGTLCGQVIPANVMLALKYGKCASDSVNRALELNPKSSDAYLSKGVGNYYLPPAFGGGVELAIRDFREAIRFNPKSADAYLWLGIAARKAGRNEEARTALKKSLEINPNRRWAKQQLEKTPVK